MARQHDPSGIQGLAFSKRVEKLKRDPALVLHRELVSGLFEDGHWTFVCSEHRPGRFLDEAEVTQHFLSREHGHVAIASTKVK